MFSLILPLALGPRFCLELLGVKSRDLLICADTLSTGTCKSQTLTGRSREGKREWHKDRDKKRKCNCICMCLPVMYQPVPTQTLRRSDTLAQGLKEGSGSFHLL